MSVGAVATKQDIIAKRAAEASVLERQLRSLQKQRAPSDPEVATLRNRLRLAYTDLLLTDVLYAASDEHDVEGSLWMRVYHKPMEVHKNHLTKFKSDLATKHPVEHRKALTAFAKFLTSATLQYRSLLEQLGKHYHVHDLGQFLLKINPDFTFAGSDRSPADHDLTAIIQRVFHSIVIRLGDLARYKELYTNLKSARQNWGQTLGYYQFARELRPSSGAPMNQLAVVAMYSNDHLSTTYHFLRAMQAKEAFPTACDNFDLGMKKIIRRYGNTITDDIRLNYLLAVSRIYDNMTTSEETIAQVCTALAEQILERNLSADQIMQICTVAISLDAHLRTGSKVLRPATTLQCAQDLLTSLIGMMLRILLHELNSLSQDKRDLVSRITPVLRRILPALRVCTRWLHLNLGMGRKVWTIYISGLTKLATVFPRSELPRLQEPLAEDLDFRGFVPLQGALTTTSLVMSTRAVLPPNQEALMRIEILLAEAATIAGLITQELGKTTTDDKPQSTVQDADHDMPLAYGDMVDNLVKAGDSDEEQLLFKGRSRKKRTAVLT